MLISGILILICIIAVYLFLCTAHVSVQLHQENALQKFKTRQIIATVDFRTLTNTPALTEGTSYFRVLREFLFDKTKRQNTSIIASVCKN